MNKNVKQSKTGCNHEFYFEVSTPMGDWYRCKICDMRIKEKDLKNYT
jgi:hypothetical protein